jgi:uncharacterized phiE125 gp8 family phage protein
MDGTLVLVTAPTIEPLLVREAKDWARITDDVEDGIVERLITTARAHVEELTGRALTTQTWQYVLDAFPCGGPYPGQIDVPRPPLQTVTFLKYLDQAGVLQTISAADYTVDAKRVPARIIPAYGKSWPSPRGVPNAITVEFIAGYGPAPTDVIEPLRQAIAVLVATLFAQREAVADRPLAEVPMAFWQLINQHRIWWL